jgi:hypothetical protein
MTMRLFGLRLHPVSMPRMLRQKVKHEPPRDLNVVDPGLCHLRGIHRLSQSSGSLSLKLKVADRATGMVSARAAGEFRARCLSGADVRAALVARWPDRTEQVQELLQELAAPHGVAKPLLVCGAPASGKTAVVRCASGLICVPIVCVLRR